MGGSASFIARYHELLVDANGKNIPNEKGQPLKAHLFDDSIIVVESSFEKPIPVTMEGQCK